MYLMRTRVLIFSLLIIAVSGACTRSDSDYKLPGVYRIDVQQGNVFSQDMLDRLKPGMEKHQVKFIMGTPTISDPFHPDRWEYIYTYTHGAARRVQQHLTIYFEDEKLAYLDGDVKTAIRKPPEEVRNRSKIVDVPDIWAPKKGLISSVINRLPFVGDDSKTPEVEDIMARQEKQPQGQQPVQEPEQSGTEEPAKPVEDKQQEDAVREPEQKGFFGRLLDKLPFIGDDDEDSEEQPATE